MPQRQATGNTTASRVKTLVLHAEGARGRADADALMDALDVDREYLEDETRPLPLPQWHAALVEFASRFGRDELWLAVDRAVDPENLGVWTRVLRGASDVGGAFRQIEQLGGDEILTDRWKTSSLGPGIWRGTVQLRPVRGDANLEGDGLMALGRALELAAVPLLFGLRRAEVEWKAGDPDESGAGAMFEYTVRWREPRSGPVTVGSGAALGGLVPASLLAGGVLDPLAGGIATAIGLAAGALGSLAVVAERRRRVQSHSQLMRIQALERSAALREARERVNAVFGEGTIVAGEYRLGQSLGRGASGAIYEATRLSDGKVVAIKLLRTAVAHDHLAADRLRREAAALGLAWHPNVVEVYDEGHLPDGTSYLVIERLYGESLESRLKRLGSLSHEELLPIAIQVCDALGAVHAAGVIHRDLKPSNIFLARAPDDEPVDELVSHVPSSPGLLHGERVKLLDFGVARIEWAETRLTNMGAPLGTPGYMSPEQEQGLEVDVRSDLFSLAVVLYECLSGQLPPTRTSSMWARDSTEERPSGIQRALDAIPVAWRAIIDRAIAQLPRERFRDARAMKQALLKLTGNEERGSSPNERRA